MKNEKKQYMRARAFLYFMMAGILLSAVCHGQQVKKIGTSSAVFLRIPVGAKGIAMGGAFTSLADDGSAMFWNPGNLPAQPGTVLFFHHSPWLPGLNYNYFGVSLPVADIGVFGINITSLRTQDIEITTLEAQMGTGETYTAASTAFGLTYAKQLTDRFSIGGTVKYLSERIFNSQAAGIAFDIGTMFITPFEDIRLGVSIANIGTDLRINGDDLNSYVDIAPYQRGNNDNIVAQLKTDPYSMPIIMRIGVSWDLMFTQDMRLTFACDGINPNDNAQSLNLGMEFAPTGDLLLLRGGYSELFLKDAERGLTLGAGLNISTFDYFNISFNYAYQEFKYLGSVNHISIQLGF